MTDASKFFIDQSRQRIETAILNLEGLGSDFDKVRRALYTALYQLDIQIEKRKQSEHL